MAKFTWQDGTLVSKAKVEIGGTIYEVDPEEYSGATPLSASNLNAMQDGIYEDIDENTENIEKMKPKILWTNSTPGNSFSEQNIPLSSTKYDFYEILFACTSTAEDSLRVVSSGKIKKGYGSRCSYSYAGSGGVNVKSRVIDYISESSIKFYDCFSSVGTTAYSQSNSNMIPLQIIGYDYNLFS